MVEAGYLEGQEPERSGSSGSHAEALGTVGLMGRTSLAMPSHPLERLGTLRGSDASTDRFTLTYYDPPESLARHVLTLFHFEWNESEIMDRHPGALGQLFLTLSGTGRIRFDTSESVANGGAFLFSGFSKAVPLEMDGPWHSVGASLSALGWAALTQAPADRHVDRVFPAKELLGEEIDAFAASIAHEYQADTMTGAKACAALADWIAPRIKPVPTAHETLIESVTGWLASSLNPDVEALFKKLAYSRRQAERLVARYFGFAPAALARKYRAIRAANLLSRDDLSDEGEAEIANAFYDQPHMIREIRRFCGQTPTRLGGEGGPLFQTLLRMRNHDRLKHFRMIGEGQDPA